MTDGRRAGRIVRHRWSVLVVIGLVGTGVTLVSLLRSRHPANGGLSRVAVTASSPDLNGRPSLLFRSTALDRNFGKLAVVPLGDPRGARSISPIKCDRSDFQAGVGLCVSQATSLFGATRALLFDSKFQVHRQLELAGIPSRVRLSADGRFAAVTNFVSGDSYATVGFSTRTDVIDLRTATVLFDLEKLQVRRNGAVIQAADFNFWGVTFAHDGQHFYATLGTGGHTYLLEGDLTTRQATVLRADVECPSLSPDGRRIAFKKRNPGPVITWRLSVLDLATLIDHPLAEARNVDDQVGWLDNNTVMYGVPSSARDVAPGTAATPGVPATSTGSVATDTWTVPAGGAGRPRLVVPGAWSTVAVRP